MKIRYGIRVEAVEVLMAFDTQREREAVRKALVGALKQKEHGEYRVVRYTEVVRPKLTVKRGGK